MKIRKDVKAVVVEFTLSTEQIPSEYDPLTQTIERLFQRKVVCTDTTQVIYFIRSLEKEFLSLAEDTLPEDN